VEQALPGYRFAHPGYLLSALLLGVGLYPSIGQIKAALVPISRRTGVLSRAHCVISDASVGKSHPYTVRVLAFQLLCMATIQ
jgi:hypothetical protein